MDAAGIDVQVLSVTTPGSQQMSAADSVPLARQLNDRAAQAVRAYPKRFRASPVCRRRTRMPQRTKPGVRWRNSAFAA